MGALHELQIEDHDALLGGSPNDAEAELGVDVTRAFVRWFDCETELSETGDAGHLEQRCEEGGADALLALASP